MASKPDVQIVVKVSSQTRDLLKRLADRGLHGPHVAGVVEGFIYRGLQHTFMDDPQVQERGKR